MRNETIYINGKDIRAHGVQALRDYRIGGTEITNYEWQGLNRSHFVNLFSQYGMKQVSFTLCFTGTYRREVEEKRTNMTAVLYGINEILMPDEFLYRCILEEIGESEWRGKEGNGWLLFVPYTLNGIQHDPLKTIEDGRQPFFVEGTLPRMDAKLTVTVGSADERYRITWADGAQAEFNVDAGDEIVFDGIEKTITINGYPATPNGFFGFPYLTHGWCQISAQNQVQVEYYPCYI